MRNQVFPDGVSTAEMDRQMDRQVGELKEQTDRGKQEAEGKAACGLAGLAALHVLEGSDWVSHLSQCPWRQP